MVKIKFETSNACFTENLEVEVARTLETIKKKILEGNKEGKVLDVNGNTIGRFEVALNDDQRADELLKNSNMIKLVEPMDKSKLSDEIFVHELALYACNTRHLHHNLFAYCRNNLFKKFLKGNYDAILARKMFYNHVPKILANYEKEYCSKGFKIKLPKYDKEYLANVILEHYVIDFEEEKKALEVKQ